MSAPCTRDRFPDRGLLIQQNQNNPRSAPIEPLAFLPYRPQSHINAKIPPINPIP
jgi:hypothetical protein